MSPSGEPNEAFELLLGPFRNIIAKASAAYVNAGTHESMLLASQKLGRDAERAIQRLEPLCLKLQQEYQDEFVKAIKANEAIGDYHLELTELLWGFDDYMTIEDFSQDKYDELKGLCRKRAPMLYNILLKLDIQPALQHEVDDAYLDTPPLSPCYPSVVPLSSFSGQRGSLAQAYQAPNRPLPNIPSFENKSVAIPAMNSTLVRRQRRISQVSSPQSSVQSHHSLDNDVEESGLSKSKRYSSISASTSSSHNAFAIVRVPSRNSPISERSLDARPNQWPLQSDTHNQEHLTQPTQVTATSPKDVPLIPACLLIDKSSSFHLYRGLCSGAIEAANGRAAVHSRQKPVHRTLTRLVGKCTGCGVEYDLNQIEADLERRDEGNLTKRNIGYRHRFLQKSHLPVKKATESLYACLFCLHNGHTLTESDATVFFTAQDLFTHLLRHPRPLPAVPNLTVVDDLDIPATLRNNYDLHLTSPPQSHPMHQHAGETELRPTGFAIKESKSSDNQIGIQEKVDEHHLAQGAKVAGIKWPPQYKGKRIFAWHDGVFASVPADIIQLKPPILGAGVQMGERTTVTAKSKWKFSPKHNTKHLWLTFGKGEIITNVGWERPESWWWWGRNSKGDRGIFPQAFIDPNTVQ